MITKVIERGGFKKSLHEVPERAKRAERLGYDVMNSEETLHSAFLPPLLAAQQTRRLLLGTSVAVAFARSPMATAYAAWDLQAFSGGRFRLGLGTQIRPHIVRRFGMEWGRPVGRFKDYILALRAIFDCWQNGTKLDFQSEFYKLNLMTPYFNPGPVEHPYIPIYISAAGPQMSRLAGQLCDGIVPSPFNTDRYLRELVYPNFKAGAESRGRDVKKLAFQVSCLIATGDTEEELEKARAAARKTIAFYGSTPAYHGVFAVHGWNDLGEKLLLMSREGKWDAMTNVISDAVVDAFAVTGKHDELVPEIKRRYGDMATEFNLTLPTKTPEEEERLASLIKQLRS